MTGRGGTGVNSLKIRATKTYQDKKREQHEQARAEEEASAILGVQGCGCEIPAQPFCAHFQNVLERWRGQDLTCCFEDSTEIAGLSHQRTGCQDSLPLSLLSAVPVFKTLAL